NPSGYVGVGMTGSSTPNSQFQVGVGTPLAAGIADFYGPNRTLSQSPIVNILTTDAIALDKGGSLGLGGVGGSPSTFSFALLAGRSENNLYAGYFQISTNNSAGTITERMRVTSAGLVGIGMPNPSQKLHVAGGNIVADGQGIVDPELRLMNPSGSTAQIWAWGTDSSKPLDLYDYTAGAYRLVVSSAGTVKGSQVDFPVSPVAYITNNANPMIYYGIGTGADFRYGDLVLQTPTDGDDSNRFMFATKDPDGTIRPRAYMGFTFGVEAIRNGPGIQRVLAVTNPANAAGVGSSIEFRNSLNGPLAGGGTWLGASIRVARSPGGGSGHSVVIANKRGGQDGEIVSDALTIGESGNVGIGTTNPQNIFQVHGSADQNLGIRFDGVAMGLGTFNDAGNTSVAMNFTASSFQFNTGAVGVGVSPAYKLHVAGGVGCSGMFRGTTNVGTGVGSAVLGITDNLGAATLPNGSLTFGFNTSSNVLFIFCKYNNGTSKTASIALT